VVTYAAGAVSELFGLQTHGDLALSKWSFLKEPEYFSVTQDTGEEMYIADNGVARNLGLDGYFTDGNYQCVLEPSAMIKSHWITLAVSKFDLPIAGVIVPDPDGKRKGWIFVLPHVRRSAEPMPTRICLARAVPSTAGQRWYACKILVGHTRPAA
jgi:hypothetical protein